MHTKLYGDNGVEIFMDGDRYLIRYDAGAHQIAMRLDEISESEAKLVMQGAIQATRVLFALQERLQASGVDPYRTNDGR
jgi:hypothetical protein